MTQGKGCCGCGLAAAGRSLAQRLCQVVEKLGAEVGLAARDSTHCFQQGSTVGLFQHIASDACCHGFAHMLLIAVAR